MTFLLQEERRREICEIVNANGKITIAEICSLYDVSEMTARRDLRDLDREGFLRRVHGGAVIGIGRSYEPSLKLRSSLVPDIKQAIGKKAAELVQDGDSIALDTGTTNLELIRALKDRRGLTIVTSSLPIANEVVSSFSLENQVRLILAGGIVRPGEFSMIGEISQNTFREFHVDKAFIGVGGISMKDGLTEYNIEDAAIKKILIESAQVRIVLADSTKIGRTTFASIAPLTAIDRLVTDSRISENALDEFTVLGIDVIVAEA